MGKRITDYLHLYLGTNCLFGIKVPGQSTTFEPSTTIDIRVLHNVNAGLAECKPILRQLSGMTDEEWGQNGMNFSMNVFESVRSPKLTYSDKPKHVLVLENRLHTNTLTFNDGMILLRMGFDLFGLIESGLAIDKATLMPVPV